MALDESWTRSLCAYRFCLSISWIKSSISSGIITSSWRTLCKHSGTVSEPNFNYPLLWKEVNSEPTLRSCTRNVLLHCYWVLRLPEMVPQEVLLEVYPEYWTVGNTPTENPKFRLPGHSPFQRGSMETDGRQDDGPLGSCQKGGTARYTVSITFLWILLVPTWILRLPIALLRLSFVMENTILRTMAILALLLGASSIATASILIASKEQLNSATKSDRWIDASRCPKLLSSIDFWTCLTWPITSFVWWVILMWLTCEFMICGHAGRYCCPFWYSFHLRYLFNLMLVALALQSWMLHPPLSPNDAATVLWMEFLGLVDVTPRMAWLSLFLNTPLSSVCVILSPPISAISWIF